MKEENSNFKFYEPAKSNRFLINIKDVNIPEYLFRKYKIFNSGDELILELEFYETVIYTFNPADFFKITEVTIHYLDPVGQIHNSLFFKIKGSNYEKKGDYKSDSVTKNKLRFIVDKQNINLLYKNEQ